LQNNDLREALETATPMIQPGHFKQPDVIEDSLRSGIQAYEAGYEKNSVKSLQLAVRLAQDSGYF
jgi:hypothetical protein